jgi:hypothetical protein
MSQTAELVFGGLQSRELAQLEELASRDPRSLSEEELAQLEGLARWALYFDDEGDRPEFCGAGLCACDGPCTAERDDLSDDQRHWLHRIRAVYLREKRRRLDLREALRRRPADSPARPLRRVIPRLVGWPRRGRTGRRVIRLTRRRRLALARLDDDPEPAGRAVARLKVVPPEAAT